MPFITIVFIHKMFMIHEHSRHTCTHPYQLENYQSQVNYLHNVQNERKQK